ncbi:NADH-quinone oxidoreductase subunit L [Shewanella cyperi]|uniref:Probable inorganic carbon transporter subunit DabB n=1 Tax=Shewanella cyperi TaxID=2814292 RepID=A0A975ALB9_9GAMM|nr:NADH-quinone oxidoreductase subunit L [Shewanella cyperi]QSX30093.1 NADH-quinone oxidoreductase subunit L [Shewanella cyperi]
MFLTLHDYLFATVYGGGFLVSLLTKDHHWLVARTATRMALLVSILSPLILGMTTPVLPSALAIVMGLLVALLGWVIVDFASRYLEGDSGQPRFVRAMLFTLFSVALLVQSDNLLLMALAWSASSLGLHVLLTHYQDRKAAEIVAHKKFIVSRMADVCLIIALFLIYQSLGTFSLPGINQQLAEMATLSTALSLAAFLFALAAILKTAQLPLHGWLIQVMEAPTPVSALLHAGIVNMGGFVLISLAALINLAPLAQTTLVVVGSMTALLAAWVMMTRISIKVRLAWSTCAQMGFMLMEIGLGLYELALLHLVAHSVYKAYCFLSAGDAVEHTVRKDYLPQIGSIKGTFVALLLSVVLVSVILLLWQQWLPALSLPVSAGVILIFGFSPLLWRYDGTSLPQLALGAIRICFLLHLYLVWHAAFAQIAPAAASTHPALLVFVCVAFTLLYIGQVVIRCYPHSKVVKRLYPWAYNGFYLDETFTRLTFKVWPARLSTEQAQTQVNRKKVTFGESA